MAEGAASDIAALLRREHRMSAPHSRDQLYDLDACERLAGKAKEAGGTFEYLVRESWN
jgi:hypothetical protein